MLNASSERTIKNDNRTMTRNKRRKTFAEISAQCERIAELFVQGYGTRKMVEFCAQLYLDAVRTHGNYI